MEIIKEIVGVRERYIKSLKLPVQWPEPRPRLDLTSRSDSTKRMFSHIHQSCLGHAENFRTSNQIKVIHLLDSYISLSDSNPLGIYMVCRSALELCAFIHEVSERLNSAKERANPDWKGGGESFFKIIVRARFATSNIEFQKLLKQQGASNSVLKPINIGECIRNLINVDGFEEIGQRYDFLCDYVHHNLGSQSINTAGSKASKIARSSGGGTLLMPGGGSITEYRYPLPNKTHQAIEDTIKEFRLYVESTWRNLQTLPDTPYSPEQCEQFTGNPIGLQRLDEPQDANHKSIPVISIKKVGRNEMCPCGSGKKFKYCCENN